MTLPPSLHSLCSSAGFFFVLGTAMLAIGDQFPFSHFPMYAVLPESTICLRVTDESGAMIALQPSFNMQASVLKKQLTRELKEARAQGQFTRIAAVPTAVSKACGGRVLEWMLANRPARDARLVGKKIKLVQVLYTTKGGVVTERSEVIAEGVARGATVKQP